MTSTEDAAHQRALALSRSLAPDKIITTDEVLCEYLAFGRCKAQRSGAGRQQCRRPDQKFRVLVVPQTRESFLAGFELYSARPDKGYSLMDCISMQD